MPCAAIRATQRQSQCSDLVRGNKTTVSSVLRHLSESKYKPILGLPTYAAPLLGPGRVGCQHSFASIKPALPAGVGRRATSSQHTAFRTSERSQGQILTRR
eukprot:6211049-Pleurochrysis_carterae.AAC.4